MLLNSETHLKKKHADSVVQVTDYSLFRGDQPGRKGGGAAIYASRSFAASEWTPIPDLDPVFVCIRNAVGSTRAR